MISSSGSKRQNEGAEQWFASACIRVTMLLSAVTDVVLNTWFPSSEIFNQLSCLLREEIILIYNEETCTDFKSNAQVGVLTKKWEVCPNEFNYHALELRKRKQIKLCSAGQHLNCRCRSSPGINQLQWSQIDLYLLRIWHSILINSGSKLISERKREVFWCL